MPIQPRRKVLITGAAGGMGRACARLFGSQDDLVLTDVSDGPLQAFADELRRDGNNVTALAGSIGDDAVLAALAAELVSETAGRAPFAVIHTAGLSPSLADWQTIMDINLVATEKLMRALEGVLSPGSVAVLIASSAGHLMPPMPDIDAVLADPLQPGFMQKVEAILDKMGAPASPGGPGGISYTLSKRAVITMAQRRAIDWGSRGARIVSISPGSIDTPMGRSELEKTSGAKMLLDATPVGRIGMSMDIAMAAQFLASPAASFISGTDLLVDGGGTVGMKLAMARG